MKPQQALSAAKFFILDVRSTFW